MALRLSRLLQQSRWVDSACHECRHFSTSSAILSGHNKWSTIKHDKARNDKAKSRERQVVGKEIANATQSTYSHSTVYLRS